jgi:hypothetical protein
MLFLDETAAERLADDALQRILWGEVDRRAA